MSELSDNVQGLPDDTLLFLLASRYCEVDSDLMDFSAWFEAYLSGKWYAFDPHNYVPRIGRVLMACGRDTADAALTTTCGIKRLESCQVRTREVSATALSQPR